MKNALKTVALTLAMLALISCGEPTLDTSSEAAMEKSLKAMTSELSQEKREEVAKSVAGVYFIIGLKGAFNGKDQSEIEAEVGEMLHGKTASQIIAIADEIEKEMNQRNK